MSKDIQGLFIRSVDKIVDWFTRTRSPWFHILNAGVAILLASLAGGVIFKIDVPGLVILEINTSQGGVAGWILFCLNIIGVIFSILGSVGLGYNYYSEQKSSCRKKIIIIEQRGLRDTSGTPLDQAVPNKIKGKRELLVNDIRQRIIDGVVKDPSAALGRVISLPMEIESRENGLDRKDISLAYGGLMPVPFSFLTGVLLDDEGQVLIYDWDRDNEKWRSLDAEDDGERFELNEIDKIDGSQMEVILAVSSSYRVDISAIRKTLGSLPLLELFLPTGGNNCHWSEEKQKDLAKYFRETIVSLNNKGIKRIHLFIAAPNSLTFRLGRTYDKRNFPDVLVYQYERSNTPPYPWGVLMPTHGKPASIVEI